MKAVSLMLLAAIVIARADEQRPIVLRDLPRLFADDSGVAEREGVVRTVHPSRTRPQSVRQDELPTQHAGKRSGITGHQCQPTGECAWPFK